MRQILRERREQGSGLEGVKRLPTMTELYLSSCCTEVIDGMVPESEWRCSDMVVRDNEAAESSFGG
jgi:hypothetical protein